MKLILILAATFVGFFSCGCATGYHASGLGGGYTDQEVGKNKYLISFRGNGYTSIDTVRTYAFKRAKEVCVEKGFDGFELIDKNNSTDHTRTPSNYSCSATGYGSNCYENGGHSVSKHTVEIIVSCSNGQN